jgi:hypothetical protein
MEQITSFIQPVKKDSPADQLIRETLNVINILYSPKALLVYFSIPMRAITPLLK